MIKHSIEDGVCTLRFDRIEKKNAITGDMYSVMAKTLEEGGEDENIRCFLVCGQSGVFTSGNDIADFLKFATTTAMNETPVMRFLRALNACKKPIVAAVDGAAIGIGTTLLFHCDMVFATPASVFKTPFVDLGLVPEAGSSLIAPLLMGHARAFELLCLGETFDAERARESGLINRVTEEAEAAALACARALASKPPEALALSREFLKRDSAALGARIEEEAKVFGTRLTSPEAIGAFQSFMSKKS